VSRARPPHRTIAAGRARRGVSIIEVLIACVLLTVGVLGIVGASMGISRQTGSSRGQVIAAGMAQARLDSLASLPCTALTGGSRTRQGITETWTVSGSGATREVSLRLLVPRQTRVITYTTLVPCV
jgi:type IV pilus assembly protein PilV